MTLADFEGLCSRVSSSFFAAFARGALRTLEISDQLSPVAKATLLAVGGRPDFGCFGSFSKARATKAALKIFSSSGLVIPVVRHTSMIIDR
jgi:hypothetical protein